MALYATLQSLSTTAGSNAADGAVDAPSTIDNQMNSLASFVAQVRDAQHEYVSAVSGTNTITGTIASNPTSYVVGRVYRFPAAATNTGAVTVNWNAIGAKSLLRGGNVAMTGGELVANCMYEAVWDGVNFQLLNDRNAGQTRQDVTATRAQSTTYTNSTGRTIQVSVVVSPSVSGNVVLRVNGTSADVKYCTASQLNTVSALVQAGATYDVIPSGGTFTVFLWTELR